MLPRQLVKPRTSPATLTTDEALDAAARELLMLVPRLMNGLKRAGRTPPEAVASARELGPRHFRALAHLVLDGEMPVGTLARHLGISLAGASLVVAELSRAGLVERRDDEADRRRTLVRIAPDHAAWVHEVIESRAAPMRRFLSGLSAPEREEFLRHLGLLADELAAAAGPEGSGPTDC
jgi:DNA-binding MarR family transcriptional regulator